MGNKSSKTNYNEKFKEKLDEVEQTKSTIPSLHNGAILSIKNIEGNNFCTSSDDKTIAIFDITTASLGIQNIIYLKGHSKAVNKVKSCNGHIWSCSRDLSIKQWDQNTNECVQTLDEAHTLNIADITVTKDGSFMASGSRDYTVKTWDVCTGKSVQTYRVPRNIVTSLCFDETSHILFQGSEDLCVRGWDVRTPARQPVIHLTGYVYFPLCIDLSPDGQYLATGCKGFDAVGCELKIWDLRKQSATINHNFTGHTQDITCCKYLNQNKIISISKDGSCGIWDIITNKKIAWNTSQKTQYTSFAIGQNEDELGRICVAITAFDGSITFAYINNSKLNTSEFEVEDHGLINIEYVSTPYQSIGSAVGYDNDS
eukprot:gene8940-18497_t